MHNTHAHDMILVLLHCTKTLDIQGEKKPSRTSTIETNYEQQKKVCQIVVVSDLNGNA